MTPPPMTEPKRKSTRVTRQTTQNTFKPFASNIVEARVLVKELVNHLTRNTNRGKISEDTWAQWDNETRRITEELTNRPTSYSEALPRLHQIAMESKYPGAKKSKRGNWIYSQEVHEKQALKKHDKAVTSTPTHRESPNLLANNDDTAETPTPTTTNRESPSLLATDNETPESEFRDINQTPDETMENINSDREARGQSVEEYKDTAEEPEERMTRVQLENNPFFHLQSEDLSQESSNSDRYEQAQIIPPQPSPPTPTDTSQETPSTPTDTVKGELDNQGKSYTLEIYQEKIKNAIEELEHNKKELEISISNQIREATNKIVEQATKEHEKFKHMSSNNAMQHTATAETIIKVKIQELVDTTANWTDGFTKACQAIHDTQGRQFEIMCKESQKRSNQMNAKAYAAQKQQHQTEAFAIEQSLTTIQEAMIQEAQSILDQMPMDMGNIKEEMETEMRLYGDNVQLDLEQANEEAHLSTVASALMAEMQHQAAQHKTDLNSLISLNKKDQTLQTMAQHSARILLRNEITTEIRNDLGIGLGIEAQMQNEYEKTRNMITQHWHDFKQEIMTELEGKIDTYLATDDTGIRIALAEVEMATLTEQTTRLEHLSTKMEERMTRLENLATQWEERATKARNNQPSEDLQQLQITNLERQHIEDKTARIKLQTRMESVEALVKDMERQMEQHKNEHDQSKDYPRMATPDTQSHRQRQPNAFDTSEEDEDHYKTPPATKSKSQRFPNVDRASINIQWDDKLKDDSTHQRSRPTQASQDQEDNSDRQEEYTRGSRYRRYEERRSREEDDQRSRDNEDRRGPPYRHNTRNNDATQGSSQYRERYREDRHNRDTDGEERYNTDEMTMTEKKEMESAIKNFDKKFSNTSELTDVPTQEQVEDLYRDIAHLANNCNIPMRSLNEIERGQPVYHEDAEALHPKMLRRYSAALWYKVKSLIPSTVPIYYDIVRQSTNEGDGFAVLYQILSIVMPKLQDFRPKWGPNLTKDIDMYRFVNQMEKFTETENTFNRPYSQLEQVTNIIQHAILDPRYEMTARTTKATLEQTLAQGQDTRLTMQNIARTLEPTKHTGRNDTHELGEDTPLIHKFETRRPQGLDPKKQVQCRSCQAWGHDGQCYMMCKLVNIQNWILANPEEATKQAALFATANSKRMINILNALDDDAIYQGIDHMMIALQDEEQQDEPTPVVTKMLAPVEWATIAEEFRTTTIEPLHPFSMVPEYIDSRISPIVQHPQDTLKTRGVVIHSMKLNFAQDKEVRKIRFTHQADGGANFAATDRLDLLHAYKHYDKPLAILAFFPQEEESRQTQEHTAIGEGILKLIGDCGEVIPMRMLYTPTSTGTVISPERTMRDMQRTNPKNNKIVNWSQNGGQHRSVQWKDKEGRVVSSLQMEERNGLYYICNATLLPPVTPTAKAMHTMPPIAEEKAPTTPSPCTRTPSPLVETVTEDNENDSNRPPDPHITIEAYLRDNEVFMSPTDYPPSHNQAAPITPNPAAEIPSSRPHAQPTPGATAHIEVETVIEDEEDRPGESRDEYLEHHDVFMEPIDPLMAPPPPLPPEPGSTQPKATDPQHTTTEELPTSPVHPERHYPQLSTMNWTSKLTQGIRQLEIWHQRMGHPSPTVLQRTQRAVEGIPKLPNAAPIFKCRFYDQAKQHKSARGKAEHNDAYLPGTMFHMDLGFFRGPSNLPAMIRDGAAPTKPTIIKSLDGHTSYLSIVDAATRHLWVFPLKTKHPPIELIDKFLQRYGTKHAKRSISTDPRGQLAQSQMFQHMCDRNGFEYQQQSNSDLAPTMEDLLASLPPQQRVIRTDGGTEFAGSHQFREKCSEYDFNVQVTGPDTSSQNGKGERPHRTLADKTRCLLYTATLGVEFWDSALVHACYLYNRTYHSAIDQTPYEAFTGFKPNCSHILTYGCTVTAKKPTGRAT